MSYTIIPIGAFDTCGNKKDTIVVTGWVLDGLLDAGKVERAYSKLVETWPILSARLRTNKETREWEYHLPNEFSPARPRYLFKKIIIQSPLRDRYRHSKPSNVITCTIKENPDDLYSQGGPRSVHDLMRRDDPMIQLQVTLFNDATLVGLTTPHVLCDGHGNKEIIRALSRILRGETVAPLQSGDPLAQFCNKKPVDAPPYLRVFGAWETVRFFVGMMADLAWNRDIQNREVFFPKEEVERIKGEAMDDLQKEHGEGSDVWISTSDALIAFCLKCIHPPTTSQTPLNILYTTNVRKYLGSAVPTPYLHNGVVSAVTPTLPVSAISTMSLGALAYHIRKAVATQTTPDAVKQTLCWRVANAGRFSLFFEPTGAWNVVTNWRDMKLMDVDFSGALSSGNEREVKCIYVWGRLYQPFPVHNLMSLVADDPNGGVWMGGFFSRSVWERRDGFGRFIRALPA